MPSERTALYALNQAKLDAFGIAYDGYGRPTHPLAAEYVARLEEAGILVVLNIDDIADEAFDDYTHSSNSIHNSVIAAVELVMERACDE